ncbi:MAG TPA: hypothetical protein VNG51_26905 [Ktedonobacteraceae bacterium]|nr:hypothetical protein [Ktedonobacteraceae bacterium]
MYIHEISWEYTGGLAHRCGSCPGRDLSRPTRLRARRGRFIAPDSP